MSFKKTVKKYGLKPLLMLVAFIAVVVSAFLLGKGNSRSNSRMGKVKQRLDAEKVVLNKEIAKEEQRKAVEYIRKAKAIENKYKPVPTGKTAKEIADIWNEEVK